MVSLLLNLQKRETINFQSTQKIHFQCLILGLKRQPKGLTTFLHLEKFVNFAKNIILTDVFKITSPSHNIGRYFRIIPGD